MLAYVVIAGGYLRVARARGWTPGCCRTRSPASRSSCCSPPSRRCGSRLDPLAYPDEPSAFVQVLFRLLDPPGAIGLALLVLAWLERHVALLLFALGYLAVVLVPINFGWGAHWGRTRGFVPQLVINGGVLLLGSAGFALAQRLRRPR